MALYSSTHINRDHQRDLAASLVAAAGLEDALNTAYENGWDGVVEQLHFMVRKGFTPTAA